MVFLLYWLYTTYTETKDRSLYITKILAMSKDGYETELTRIQSKRNLFKFIKTYLTKEANFVSHPEGFWWKRAVFHKRKAIEESFQQFILNNAPKQEQEDFAYEGIFDKNKEPDATPMKGSKRLESNFMNAINRSTMGGEELKMLQNASNTLINNEQSSDYSKSPHSSNSRPVGTNLNKRMRQNFTITMGNSGQSPNRDHNLHHF